MKFLFIFPSSGKLDIFTGLDRQSSKDAFVPPLGLLYISRALEDHNHEVEIIDCYAENVSKATIESKVLSSDAVGMTVYSEQKEFNNAIELSKLIKKIDPKIPLIIGGPRVTIFPEDSIKSLNADVGVSGPGEFVITKIADVLEGKGDFKSIPGVYFKVGNKIKTSNKPNKIENLDTIAFPARHLVDKYKYGYMFGMKLMKGKVTSILTSRGCPFNCTFCSLRTHIPNFQDRSSENVIEEIDEIIKQGYETIVFVDDNFLCNKKKVEKIMDFIIQKDVNIKMWVSDIRADSADRNLFKKMKDAGVESVSFGIESGNQDVLDYYNKRLTISQIRETVGLSNKMGFFTFGNFILGAPFETKEHFENTINFSRQLELDGVIFYSLGYPYGSKIQKDAIKEGKIDKDEILTIRSDSKIGLGNFTKEELLGYVSKGYKKFYYDPKYFIRELRKAFYVKNFRLLKLGIRLKLKKY